MSVHESIVNVLLSLGYTKTEGGCQGFSIKWLEACLLNEEHLFDVRIKRIDSEGEALIHSINAVTEKKGKKLTAEDNELLDILAFYDHLELYQSPEAHYLLFNAPLNQDDVDTISTFASSSAMLSRGGLARIYSEPGIYTKKEIKGYLDGLGVVIEKASAESTESLGIVLSSTNHVIALTYTSGKGWKFMDINQYPSKSFMIHETDLLAACIMTGFIQSNSPYSAFNVAVFSTGNHVGLLGLKEIFDQFKKSHQLTKEVASRETEGIGLAHIAAQYNHSYVISELAKHGVDLNKTISNGSTPAYIAAENGYASVIAELAKHGVDLNQVDIEGVTLPIIAAQEGHASVIEELAKHQVDLNQALNNGATLAYIAAENGRASVIAELAKWGVDFNKAKSDGVTPAFIAAQEGHASVISELIKVGVNFHIPYMASVAGLRQFSTSYCEEVIERMNDYIDEQLDLSLTSHTISMTPYHIALVMGHGEIQQLLNKKEEQDQTIGVITGDELMEKQSDYDEILGNGYTFFSSSVNEVVASNGLSQLEYSDVTPYEHKKRKLGRLDDPVSTDHGYKKARYRS